MAKYELKFTPAPATINKVETAVPNDTDGQWYELTTYREDTSGGGRGFYTLIIWQDNKKVRKHNFKKKDAALEFADSQYIHYRFKLAKLKAKS